MAVLAIETLHNLTLPTNLPFPNLAEGTHPSPYPIYYFFTSQHTNGYQSFEALWKMTRHQQVLTWHGFDTTSILIGLDGYQTHDLSIVSRVLYR